MAIDGPTLAAILGMALVTYATRATGFWLMARVTLTPRIERFLEYLAGSVLISLVVPAAIEGGPVVTLAVVAAVAVAATTGRSLPAILLAVALAAALRGVIG